MTKDEILKLRAHLRRSFGSPALTVTPSAREREAADVTLGERKIGKIILDDEDGDRSFSFAMPIPVDRATLQEYLRKLFENDKLKIVSRMKKIDFGRAQQRRRLPRRRLGRRQGRQRLHPADGDPRFRSRGPLSVGRPAYAEWRSGDRLQHCRRGVGARRRGRRRDACARRACRAPRAGLSGPGRRETSAASAVASACGWQSRCRNSGIAASPSTRLGSSTENGSVTSGRSSPSSARHLVGADQRHAGERELERDGARRGERRARAAEGGELLRFADDDARRARPSRGERAHLALDMRQGRQNDVERARLALGGGDRRAEIGHQSRDHRAARAGQGEDDRRRRGAPARLVSVRPQFGEPLDQRMADIDAVRAAEPRMRFRLERQQRQHAIDIGAHRRRAAGPPRPDRRADIVDHRQIRQRAPDAARDAMGEIGAVDDDERVGARGDDRRRGAADAIEQRRQALDAPAARPSPRRRRAETGSSAPRRPSPRRRRRETRRRRPPARRSARISLKPSWSPDGSPATTAMRNRRGGALMARSRRRTGRQRRRRARPPRARRSARAPAATATPCNCALAAAAIVCGPIAGMSRRKSWPRLGALTNTPDGPERRSRRASRSSATRASIASVPSAASIATTRPSATTTPWPASNGDSAAISAAPMRMSASACGATARAPIGPSGASSCGAISWAPTTLQAFALEDRRDAGEQVVVAAAKRLRELGQRA